MVLNDIPKDIKKFMVDLDWTQTDLSDAIGVSDKTISRLLHRKSERFFNPDFLDAMEELGYDIRLEYVERKVE